MKQTPNQKGNTMKKVLTTLIAAAIALATFSGVAQAQTAPEDLPVGYTGVTSVAHGFTIVESGFWNNPHPINKFVVSIKNKDMITVNYQNPGGLLGLTVWAHDDATNGPDWDGPKIIRKRKNMPRNKNIWVDLSALPGNIFYVTIGDSTPTKVTGGVRFEIEEAPAPKLPEAPAITDTCPAASWDGTFDADGFPVVDGLSQEQAEEVIKAHGWSYRYVSIDGSMEPISMDLAHGRYNLTVEAGCVVSADVEVFNVILPEGIGFDPMPELPIEFPPAEIPRDPLPGLPIDVLPPEADPCNSPYLEPVTGEGMMFQHNDCQWGIITFVQEDCGEAFIRIEFESPVPERAGIFFNGEAIVDGVLEAGVHTFDVTDLLTEDNNMVDAFIGDQGQTFFMVGNVEICAEAPEKETSDFTPEDNTPEDEAPETEEKLPVIEEEVEEIAITDEAPETEEKLPVIEEEVEEIAITDEAPETEEKLPRTGGMHLYMVVIALALLVAGSLLLASSKIRAAHKVIA